MRTIIYIILLAITFNSYAQEKMNEQRAMKESHIDFTKEYIFFTISGLIEIDGHTFKNDSCKNPIQFQANLDGVLIIDTLNKIEYCHRKCNKINCEIIHLDLKKYDIINNYIPNYLPNIKFNN